MHSSSFYPFLVISSPARGQAVRLWACSSGEATLGDIEHTLMSSSGASELAGDGTGLAAIGSPAPSGLQAALPRRTAWARSLSLSAREAPLPCLLRRERRPSRRPSPAMAPLRSSLPCRTASAATPLPSSLPTAAELCGVDGPRCGQLPTEARRADGGAGPRAGGAAASSSACAASSSASSSATAGRRRHGGRGPRGGSGGRRARCGRARVAGAAARSPCSPSLPPSLSSGGRRGGGAASCSSIGRP